MTTGHVEPRFSIGEALSVGWSTFLRTIGPMALYALVVAVITGAVSSVVNNVGGVAGFLLGVLSFLVNQLVAIGWLRLALDAVDGRPVSAERITESFDRLLPYAVAAFVFSIAVALGAVLLIVPGVIVVLVWGFYGWSIVDGRTGDPIGAFRYSAQITRGNRLQLFGFGLTLIAINILGLLVLLVGVLVSLAVSILAIAFVYRRLSGTAAPAAPPGQAPTRGLA